MRVFRHYVYLPIAILAAAEFAVASASFMVAALLLGAFGWAEASQLSGAVSLSPAFAVAVLIGLTGVGLYQSKQRLKIEGVLARIVVGLGIAAICLALVNLVIAFGVARLLWPVALTVCLVLLSATRIVLWHWVDHTMFQRRVLVFGAGERAASLLKLRRRSDRRGFNIVGFVPAPGDKFVMEDGRVMARDAVLLDYAVAEGVDEVVVAMDDRRQGFPIRQLLDCRFAGIAVVDLLDFLERETGRLKVELVNPAWLIFSEGFDADPRRRVATRAFDFLSALVLLVLAFPIMLLVAIAIVIDDGRPVFYRQRRVGLGGTAFTLCKFRSMIKNAEADGKAQWAGTSDSRITRVGGVLRKLRFDELPQLLNVLRGDMSMVGPRPERPEFVQRLSEKIPYYHERHTVKPGITGWAQLCYPYGSSDEDAMEKLQFDLYYIKYKSLIFDLMVLLQTAEVVLWGKGAR